MYYQRAKSMMERRFAMAIWLSLEIQVLLDRFRGMMSDALLIKPSASCRRRPRIKLRALAFLIDWSVRNNTGDTASLQRADGFRPLRLQPGPAAE
jgi:hypothetical protein